MVCLHRAPGRIHSPPLPGDGGRGERPPPHLHNHLSDKPRSQTTPGLLSSRVRRPPRAPAGGRDANQEPAVTLYHPCTPTLPSSVMVFLLLIASQIIPFSCQVPRFLLSSPDFPLFPGLSNPALRSHFCSWSNWSNPPISFYSCSCYLTSPPRRADHPPGQHHHH